MLDIANDNEQVPSSKSSVQMVEECRCRLNITELLVNDVVKVLQSQKDQPCLEDVSYVSVMDIHKIVTKKQANVW